MVLYALVLSARTRSGAAAIRARTASVDRRACACGCAVDRTALRRGRGPGRSGHLHLPGEPEWRTYFRSTIGHNCLELGAKTSRSRVALHVAQAAAVGGRDERARRGPAVWRATHDGYRRLSPAACTNASPSIAICAGSSWRMPWTAPADMTADWRSTSDRRSTAFSTCWLSSAQLQHRHGAR